jgi:hypothetical protein
MERNSCYGCDEFIAVNELESYPLQGITVELCPLCIYKAEGLQGVA